MIDIEQIDSSLEDIVTPEVFSGVIVLAKDYSPVYYSYHGFANRTTELKPNLDTKFNLGSLNKMITSIAIAQLVGSNKLSYDDTVADILPNTKIDRGSQIKVHHLLTHTSGLGILFSKEFMENIDKYYEIRDRLPIIEKEKLAFTPGEGVKYSNSGFEVLGLIVEEISGLSYFDYVRENIYLPAGMKDTDSYSIEERIGNFAEGYTRMSMKGPDVKEELRPNRFLGTLRGSAAGGGYSTANDLIRFSKALFSYKLLSEDLTKHMLKGRVQPNPEQENVKIAYGFGVHVFDHITRYGHTGGAPGINAFFGVYRPVNYTLIVLSNFDPPAAENVAKRINSLLLEHF